VLGGFGEIDVLLATCDDFCPYIPGKRYISWQLPDPKGRWPDEVRALRDDVERQVAELATGLRRDAV
jgi:arsenate reductase (thioredoxin)